MKTPLRLKIIGRAAIFLFAGLFFGVSDAAFAQNREATLVSDSAVVVREIMEIPVKSIPLSLFQQAEGMAIFPSIMKGGFILGVQHGEGTLLVKDKNGQWEYPRFVTLTGGSLGFQAGVQSADIILIFCTRRSVESALAGRFTIGADASVAAGPVGRQTSAATDYQFTAEIYSYSRSRGLFLGAAIDGSAMELTATEYYKNGVPKEAQDLVNLIAGYAKPEN